MYRRGPSTVCLQNGGNAGVVRPEHTVGLVEHAGSFWTGRVEVYMVVIGWVIFCHSERLGDFFLILRGWVIFLPREVG